MIQTGTVIETISGNKAKIHMKKHSACGDCGACQHGKENMELNIVAINEIGAKPGDFVEVNMETQNVMGAAFIIYVIPLLALLLGIGLGSYVLNSIGIQGNREVYAAGIGFLLTIIAYLTIKRFEGTFNKDKKYVPVVTKVLD
ncbi:sigma-E factor negative regulatory protein RseC [Anaerosolibacter carboniphilus]|uniref:Sigma-E factor negative regulatory protein RseC n=1 Tax=Anaerosolibacter carboniphilus TaxID=1417629 RepID=A0A841KRQ2_9FIRM|nr:SoxR reducing system RseC family protein [Anaerosolibacter carboniphilus]MBB6214828.1 sigma-E factor negative regulatory protein RseC [Anaerosolibacter carboniphilus]